ncbi:MAG: hypothetical protein ACOC1U_06505 [Spirochaetota bacterium]
MRSIAQTVLILVLVVAAAPPMVAQSSGPVTSVGVILGEPTGLAARQWVGGGVGFDAALAWSFRDPGSIYAHVDYQQHFESIPVEVGRLLLFAGIGAKIYLSTEVVIGARVPLGVFYEFEDAPFELFFELAPGLNFFPTLEPDAGGGLGILYRL